jgi:hypothetical protein
MASDASAGKGRRVPVGFFTADTDPDVILDAIDAALASLPPGSNRRRIRPTARTRIDDQSPWQDHPLGVRAA